MHELQKILLKRLFTQNNQRYGSLTSGYDFEDNVVFHLRQVIERGLIEKKNRIYTITLKGIKTVAKLEPEGLLDKGVKTFFIGFLCDDSEGCYLLKSHSQAKVNFYNLPSGRPYFGEEMGVALARTFKENTGIKLTSDRFKFTSLHLKTIKTKSDEVLFDDAFCVYKVSIIPEEKGQLQLSDQVGWFSIDRVSTIENKWPEIDMCVLGEDLGSYKVYTHISDYIL
jgi:ADP-ribose pyrophosphatase YjhB (NUDIX family)